MKYLIPLCFAALAGCASDVPTADDVRTDLEQAWSSCKGLKVVDIKKTNGIPQADTYQMAVSWKLKFLRDFPGSTVFGDAGACEDKLMQNALFAYALQLKKFDDFKKGDTMEISNVFTMIKSEKGWIQK